MDGDILTGRPPEAIARLGLSMVPEGREIFGSLTVEENLRVGTGIRRDKSAIEGDISEIYDSFPHSGRTPSCQRWCAVWWAATDVGDWPWANDQSEIDDGG